MSDLSERLRISAMHGTYDGTGECHATASDVAEAADEIERLREQVAGSLAAHLAAANERDRMRAALQDVLAGNLTLTGVQEVLGVFSEAAEAAGGE